MFYACIPLRLHLRPFYGGLSQRGMDLSIRFVSRGGAEEYTRRSRRVNERATPISQPPISHQFACSWRYHQPISLYEFGSYCFSIFTYQFQQECSNKAICKLGLGFLMLLFFASLSGCDSLFYSTIGYDPYLYSVFGDERFQTPTIRDYHKFPISKDSLIIVNTIVSSGRITKAVQYEFNDEKIRTLDSAIRALSLKTDFGLLDQGYVLDRSVLDSALGDLRKYKYTGYRMPKKIDRPGHARYLICRYWRLWQVTEIINKPMITHVRTNFSMPYWSRHYPDSGTKLELHLFLLDTDSGQIVLYKQFVTGWGSLVLPRAADVNTLLMRSEKVLARVVR